MEDCNDEIDVLQEIRYSLEKVDHEARKRILHWAISKYDVSPTNNTINDSLESQPNEANSDKEFVDIFDAASPDKNGDKVLLAAYWSQVYLQKEGFTSREINELLADLGHRINHMPSTMKPLENTKPALVRQVKKSGKSQQAQKKYKLTEAGLKYVESMIQN